MIFAAASRGIASIPFLSGFLGGEIRPPSRYAGADAILGWGARPSGRRAEQVAANLGVRSLRLEDGFLRSFGSGHHFPPLALVVDEDGIYYDATRRSRLEKLLQDGGNVLAGIEDEVERAMVLILERRLSKYNDAPLASAQLFERPAARRVLVVDQVAGDLSVSLGGADGVAFRTMLEAARAENPDALIYVKSHPEVVGGGGRGYLDDIAQDGRTVLIRDAVNPISLVERMDRVYVVTSQLGFEALLHGKPVTCFGMPWYSGWGVTDDRQFCRRRTHYRSVTELFAAAYFHYTRYLDPVTRRRGTIFDVIYFLSRQSRMDADAPGRSICIGFRKWKAPLVRPFLSLKPGRGLFVADAAKAASLAPGPRDRLVCWGREAPPGARALANSTGVQLWRMEDGFMRSVGLGADFVQPLSLILDRRGIHFDAGRESDLEHLLNTAQFTQDELEQARAVRERMVREEISKYNTGSRAGLAPPPGDREVVLVPGQVEDDASIRFGCEGVATNLALLAAAREAHPEAWLIYKPHPDVMAFNRRGRLGLKQALEYADQVEARAGITSCIKAADVVHTMTSQAGFDALLYQKRVVVHGRPFYAGWGVTEDRLPIPRRTRRLSLDELVAGALLRYPLYWDWELKGYTTCMAVLERIVEEREKMAAKGELNSPGAAFLMRQVRKLAILLRAWMPA